jgi:hypothetical protein
MNPTRKIRSLSVLIKDIRVVLDAPSKEKTEALIQATQRNLERGSS